jgi:hypothetical protein
MLPHLVLKFSEVQCALRDVISSLRLFEHIEHPNLPRSIYAPVNLSPRGVQMLARYMNLPILEISPVILGMVMRGELFLYVAVSL